MKKIAFLFIFIFTALCLASCADGTCEHEFGEWKTTSVADCTTIGTQARICSRCKKTEVEKVAPLDHNFTVKATKKECYKGLTEDGKYEIYFRSCICGKIGNETFLNEPINSTSHFTYSHSSIEYGGAFVLRLVAYNGEAASIVIPDTYGGEPVASIGRSVFKNCTSLQSVTIPDNIETIEQEAFYGCTSLQSVTIGNGVTSIGACAFYGCSALQSVTIPDNVTSISSYAFYGCALNSVIFEDTSTWYRTGGYESWQNKTGGTETDVSDPEDAADYLRKSYRGYYYYLYKL